MKTIRKTSEKKDPVKIQEQLDELYNTCVERFSSWGEHILDISSLPSTCTMLEMSIESFKNVHKYLKTKKLFNTLSLSDQSKFLQKLFYNAIEDNCGSAAIISNVLEKDVEYMKLFLRANKTPKFKYEGDDGIVHTFIFQLNDVKYGK
jgi:hypothetical protein